MSEKLYLRLIGIGIGARDYKKKNPQKINAINKAYYRKRVNELQELREFKAMILAKEKEKKEKVKK